MYLPLIEVSLDWCYNKIASRFKVTWNKCHIISSKLALQQQFYQLTTAFTKGRGLATATEMWLQKWFCVVSIFIANNVLSSNVGELSWSWILKNNISKFRKRRKFHHGLFTSSLKREVSHFHVVVVQWCQRNVQKSVLHVQCFFFAYWTYWCCDVHLTITVIES